MRLWVIYILAFFAVVPQLYAGAVNAELDKTEGTLDDEFYYTLTVEGRLESDVPRIAVDGLRIDQRGTSSSTQITFGKITQSVIYQYVIQPERSGSFTIPSLRLKVDGKDQKTKACTFQVTAGGAAAGGPGGGDAQPFFVEREITQTSAYVGEPVSVRTRIYAQANLVNISDATPTFAGVRRMREEKHKSYERVIEGTAYQVVELFEILIPLKSGALKIPPAAFVLQYRAARNRARSRGAIDDFFSDPFFGGGSRVVEKTVRSSEAVIDVKSLPVANRPPKFSGLVGNFQMQAELSGRSAKVGETLNLKVRLFGQGSLEGFDQFPLNLDPSIKIYADKPTVEQVMSVQDGLRSERLFNFALVPTKAGEFSVGPITLSIFIPSLGSFAELRADVDAMTVGADAVMAGSEGVAVGTGNVAAEKQSVRAQRTDLIGLHAGKDLLKLQILTAQDVWCVVGMVSGASIFCLAGFQFQQWRQKKGSQIALRRRRGSLRKFKKHLAALPSDQSNNASDLLRAFQIFCGDLMQKKGEAFTSEEILRWCVEAKIDSSLMEKITQQLRVLEAAVYGGKASGGQNASLRDALLDVAKSMDEALG